MIFKNAIKKGTPNTNIEIVNLCVFYYLTIDGRPQ